MRKQAVIPQKVISIWNITGAQKEELGYYNIAKRIYSVEDTQPRQTASNQRVSMLLTRQRETNANTGKCRTYIVPKEPVGKPSTGHGATMAVEQQLSRFSFVAEDPICCSFLRQYAKRTYCEENLNLFIAVKLFHSQYDSISRQEKFCKSSLNNFCTYRFAPGQHDTLQRSSNLSDGSDDIVDTMFSRKRNRSIGELAQMIWNRFCDDSSKVR